MILGETLEEIATHKAGIIKKNCPVVVYEQSDEVMDVVNKCADALDSNVTIARTGEYTGEKFDYATACGYEYENLKLGLEGSWQRKNAVLPKRNTLIFVLSDVTLWSRLMVRYSENLLTKKKLSQC